MRRINRSEFEEFLRQVDLELSSPCRVVIIGGAAVSLAFKGMHATTDLDLWSASSQVFWEAIRAVNERSGTFVPVHKATIAEPPYHFEDRLIFTRITGLRWLEVLVPEAHDLVWLKAARAEAHDLDAIEDIHRAHPLALKTLIETRW